VLRLGWSLPPKKNGLLSAGYAHLIATPYIPITLRELQRACNMVVEASFWGAGRRYKLGAYLGGRES